MIEKLKDKIVAAAKAAYATPTGYRIFWTAVQLGTGAVVVAFGADPAVGLVVTLLATAVSSVARERLAKTS